MEVITRKDFIRLMAVRRETCVSLYMPAHPRPADIREDQIRFKNRLRKARAQLGDRARQVDEMLGRAEDLLIDTPFWQYQGDGLALFITSGEFRYYRLPLAFSEIISIGDRFHLKPLLPLFTEDGQFYVLALSRDEVRFLQCTRFSARESRLAGVPRNIGEAFPYHNVETYQHHHMRSGKLSRGGADLFAGHGEITPDDKRMLAGFLKKVSAGVHDALSSSRFPLVLAGVDYVCGLYRDVNRYPALLDKEIHGNTERFRPEELRAKALDIVGPGFDNSRTAALDRYRRLIHLGRTRSDLQEIVALADRGRLGTIFVPCARQKWGAYDAQSGRVEFHEHEIPGDEDLLDFAALAVLKHGGEVFMLNDGEMPCACDAAAITRY